ncbi:hypothetical protein LCGC14_1043430, partial [marine sediment metagenome]
MSYQSSTAPIPESELKQIPCFRYINPDVAEKDLEQWDQWFMRFQSAPEVYSIRAPNGEELVHQWSRDRGLKRFDVSHPLFQKWRRAVEVSLRESPVRTRTSPRWKKDDWQELADAFVPHRFKRREKKCLTR